jgi:hypothetical protein
MAKTFPVVAFIAATVLLVPEVASTQAPATGGTPSPQDVVMALDRVRNPDQPFRVTNTSVTSRAIGQA